MLHLRRVFRHPRKNQQVSHGPFHTGGGGDGGGGGAVGTETPNQMKWKRILFIPNQSESTRINLNQSESIQCRHQFISTPNLIRFNRLVTFTSYFLLL